MRPVHGGFTSNGGIDQRQGVLVLDEVGAPGDRIDHRRRDRTGGEQGGGAGQPVPQGLGDTHLFGRGVRVEVAGRGHRGLGPRPAVDHLMGDGVVLVIALAGDHLTDQRQPVSRHGGLGLGRGRDRGDERLIAHPRDRGPDPNLRTCALHYSAPLRRV